MLIKYKPKIEHIKTIPLIPSAEDPKSYNRSIVQLMPGTNEVSEDEWAAIKPHIAAEIKSGEIVPFSVDAPKSKAPDKKAKTLKDVPARIAKEIIEKCVNPATLKKWFAEETRDEVLLIVIKRMRKLKLDPDEIEKENDKAQGEGSLDGDIEPETDDGGSEGRADGEGKSGKGKKRGKKGAKTPEPAPEDEDDGDDDESDEGGEDDFSDFDKEE